MSLNRLALRLATVVALTNNGAAPYPTIAGARVYDARLDPIEKAVLNSDGPYPIVVVYTDEQTEVAKGHAGSAIPTVGLVIQFGIAVRDQEAAGDDDPIGFPATDSELDTALDIFEAQIVKALGDSEIWNGIRQGIGSSTSIRAQAENGARVAIRYLITEVSVLRDVLRGAVPAHIAPLLAALDENPAYAARSAEIRAVWTDPVSSSEAVLRRLALHQTTAIAEALGSDLSDPAVTISAPVSIAYTNDQAGGTYGVEDGS